MKPAEDQNLLQAMHDILSPLSVIKIVSATGDDKVSPALRQQLICEAVRRIEGIAETLLARHRVVSEGTALLECVTQAVREKQVQYPHVRIDLHLDEKAGGMSVPGGEIQRLLSNLMNNAAEAGATAITVKAEAHVDGWSLSVVDNGEGLPAHTLEKFARGEFQSCGGKAGLGLGLAHMQKVLQALGGKLRLDSAPGQGACFTLQIPA